MKQSYKLIGACFSVALLAACGGTNGLSSSTPIVAPQIAAPESATRGFASQRLEPSFSWQPLTDIGYKSLYSFKGSQHDGGIPEASLLAMNGVLYGTRVVGGSRDNGTVFDLSTSGKERVLYSFYGVGDGSGTDSATPFAGLVEMNGALYGTTYAGGLRCGHGSECGTVLEVSTAGSERVVYRFKKHHDGSGPTAGLINVNGVLYGTTQDGGTRGQGTVFAITTSGEKTVLHSFTGGSSDGAYPIAGLSDVKGTLYGTAEDGGANNDGSVFAITTSGKETTLYSFKSGRDGAYPQAVLINVKDTLYGTTFGGGGLGCGSFDGCGTVFKMRPSGKETVLYRFKGGTDGAQPYAGLINVKGILYGTTGGGGTTGNGTVFRISP